MISRNYIHVASLIASHFTPLTFTEYNNIMLFDFKR